MSESAFPYPQKLIGAMIERYPSGLLDPLLSSNRWRESERRRDPHDV